LNPLGSRKLLDGSCYRSRALVEKKSNPLGGATSFAIGANFKLSINNIGDPRGRASELTGLNCWPVAADIPTNLESLEAQFSFQECWPAGFAPAATGRTNPLL